VKLIRIVIFKLNCIVQYFFMMCSYNFKNYSANRRASIILF